MDWMNMKRGEIYYADLDPTVGSEIRKKRPVLIISNDANKPQMRRKFYKLLIQRLNNAHHVINNFIGCFMI